MALYNITTEEGFGDKVLGSTKTVLVDFWAPWCPPCRAMAPGLESLAKSMDKDLDVVKVDIEASSENRQLANKYGVRGIPNMQVFQHGDVVEELVGMRPEHVLEHELRSIIDK